MRHKHAKPRRSVSPFIVYGGITLALIASMLAHRLADESQGSQYWAWLVVAILFFNLAFNSLADRTWRPWLGRRARARQEGSPTHPQAS